MVPIGVSGVAFVSYGFIMVVMVVAVVVDIEFDSAIVEALGVAVIRRGCILLMATSEQKAMPTTRRLGGNSMIRNGLRESDLIFSHVQERR